MGNKYIQMSSIKRTTELNETKLSIDVPYKVLMKCCYLVADLLFTMAPGVYINYRANIKPNLVWFLS